MWFVDQIGWEEHKLLEDQDRKEKETMEKASRYRREIVLVLVVMPLFFLTGHFLAHAEMGELSKAVFYVQWYDVGKAALEGLKGVKRVEKGFRRFKEINTVYYDASIISIEEMEEALKKVKTYRGTVK